MWIIWIDYCLTWSLDETLPDLIMWYFISNLWFYLLNLYNVSLYLFVNNLFCVLFLWCEITVKSELVFNGNSVFVLKVFNLINYWFLLIILTGNRRNLVEYLFSFYFMIWDDIYFLLLYLIFADIWCKQVMESWKV
jgi:hypothetical protein